VHTVQRVIECNPEIYQTQAPWRIELPQGGTIRGTAQQVGTWPADLDTLPSNQRILQAGQSGPGKVVEDNTNVTESGLTAHNAGVPGSLATGSGGCSVARGPAPLWMLLVLSSVLGALGWRRRRANSLSE
jgi:MYXO-CTERM domain-containing protein